MRTSRVSIEVQRPVIYYLFEKQIPLFFLFRYLAISSELSHLVTAMNLIQKKMSPPWRHHGHIYRFLTIYFKINAYLCSIYLIFNNFFFFNLWMRTNVWDITRKFYFCFTNVVVGYITVSTKTVEYFMNLGSVRTFFQNWIDSVPCSPGSLCWSAFFPPHCSGAQVITILPAVLLYWV